MKRKNIFIMAPDELDQWPTSHLIGRLQRLRECEESLEASDQAENDDSSTNSIEFKNSVQWAEAYQQLKTILSQREHVAKRTQLVKLRHEKAQTQKSKDRRI